MKIKSLLLTLLFATSMWAQTAVPAGQSNDTHAQATCCKDGASCCKDGAACCKKADMAKADCCKEGAACCGKDKTAKADTKDCCGGKMCNRHKTEKS